MTDASNPARAAAGTDTMTPFRRPVRSDPPEVWAWRNAGITKLRVGEWRRITDVGLVGAWARDYFVALADGRAVAASQFSPSQTYRSAGTELYVGILLVTVGVPLAIVAAIALVVAFDRPALAAITGLITGMLAGLLGMWHVAWGLVPNALQPVEAPGRLTFRLGWMLRASCDTTFLLVPVACTIVITLLMPS